MVTLLASAQGSPGLAGTYNLNVKTVGSAGTNDISQSGPIEISGDGKIEFSPATTSLAPRSTLVANMQVAVGEQTAQCTLTMVGQK
jgi:hypothetical protein